MINPGSMKDILHEELLQSVVEGLSCPDDPAFAKTIERLRTLPGKKVRDIIAELLVDPDASLALGITRAVGLIPCPEAGDILIALVDEPGKWFSHAQRASIQIEAIKSLGFLKHQRGCGILIDLILQSHHAEIQMEAIAAIGMIGSPSSVEPLLAKMNSDPPSALSAAGAVAQIGGEEAFQGLMNGLRSDEEMIRSACIWALGKMADERAIDPLLTLAEKSDDFMRRDIVWSLGQIGGLRARLSLGAIMQHDPDIGVRREAARAIKSGAVLGAKPLKPSGSPA